MTFIELELRSLRLRQPLICGQTVVPSPPMLDALIFVSVEDAGVEFPATQVAVHGVGCCGQLWVFRCFRKVLRDWNSWGACRGHTFRSVQWTHTQIHSDTSLSSVTKFAPFHANDREKRGL